MAILAPKAFQTQARLQIQAIITSLKQSPIEPINLGKKNPLIFHNLVAYNTHLLRAVFKNQRKFSLSIQSFFLKQKLLVFSDQIFERHFNSNDRRELIELRRNLRVLEFFVFDLFVHKFSQRPNWHILYEDVFFQTINVSQAKIASLTFNKLFKELADCQNFEGEVVEQIIKKSLSKNESEINNFKDSVFL